MQSNTGYYINFGQNFFEISFILHQLLSSWTFAPLFASQLCGSQNRHALWEV